MAHLKHIDEEKYAARALEIFNNERDNYVRYAYGCLKDGITQEGTREHLVDRVESYMKRALFGYLKRAGIVEGDIRYDFTLGYCRRKRVEPTMSDVPSRLLNFSEVLMMSGSLPEFAGLIDSVMVDAGILLKVYEIEAATEEACSKTFDENDECNN